MARRFVSLQIGNNSRAKGRHGRRPCSTGGLSDAQSFFYGATPAINTVVAPVSVLNTSKLRRRLSLGTGWVNDLDLGSHFGSDLFGRIGVGGQRTPVPPVIDGNDPVQWQSNHRLSERKSGGIDKAPTNKHTIWYTNVDEVEPRSLIHGYANRSEADPDTRKDVGLRPSCTKSQ